MHGVFDVPCDLVKLQATSIIALEQEATRGSWHRY